MDNLRVIRFLLKTCNICFVSGRGGRGVIRSNVDLYVVVKCPLPYYRVVVVVVALYQILISPYNDKC